MSDVIKTILVPMDFSSFSEAAVQTAISRAYKIAWQSGAKGITVFRSGCKGAQVLNVGRLPDEMVHPRWRGNPCIHCSEEEQSTEFS